MGLYTTALINVLQTICERGTENKTLCMIGRQEIIIEWKPFMKTVERMQLEYDKNIYESIKNIYPINTYLFFNMFGIKEVYAIDYNGLDGADVIFNLNHDLPECLYDKYDYIIDGGTLEHVFDIARAMKNLTKMLRNGGIVIHILPLGGYVEHGFYNFSPTFFLDYYTINDFFIHRINMEFMMGDINLSTDGYNYAKFEAVYSQDCRLFLCDSHDWAHKQINSYLKKMGRVEEIGHIYLWCIAEKRKIKEIEYPIQGVYQQIANCAMQNSDPGFKVIKNLSDFKEMNRLKNMNLQKEFEKIIQNSINCGKTEFLIYPFGRNGILFKQILNEKYGIEEKVIFDNNLCKSNLKVRPIREINQFYSDKSCFVLTSNNAECRNEFLKYGKIDMLEVPDAFFPKI